VIFELLRWRPVRQSSPTFGAINLASYG